MDGAVQSGVRAALEVLDILKPQTLSSEDFKVMFCKKKITIIKVNGW